MIAPTSLPKIYTPTRMENTMHYIVDEHLISIGEYCYQRLLSWRAAHDDSGEVSATTVVLAAALIALALSVGVIVSGKVRDKANSLDLG